MSRIDLLIAELCPGGAEYKPLGEVGTFTRGGGLQKKDFVEEGVGCIHYGQVYTHYGIWATETLSFVTAEFAENKRKVRPGDIFIATTSENDEDLGKAVAWLGNDDIVASGDAYIFRHSLDAKYVSYFLSSASFQEQKKRWITGTKVRRIAGSALEKILIPVPPIEIQRAIVEILDKFTKLEAELEAELEARKKQYVYYRNNMLDFAPETEVALLGDLANNLDRMRKPVTRDARAPGEIPYYGASGIVDYVSDYIFDGDYLLVSEDGANLLARSTPIAFSISGKTWVNNHAHVLEFDTYVERRFVEIFLNSIDLTPYISGAAQPKLNKANLNKIPIPKPSLEEKSRIVEILDKFDALVNDLSSGLPAEIAARRKQYEYYRDQLLTFKEVVTRT